MSIPINSNYSNLGYNGRHGTTGLPSMADLQKQLYDLYGPEGKPRTTADGGYIMMGVRPVDVRIGGEYTYEKEDSVNRLGTLHFKMDGDFTKGPTAYGTTESGFSLEDDFSWMKIDFNTISQDNPDGLQQEIEFMASRYAVVRNRILQEGTDTESMLTKLQESMKKYSEQLANNFADAVSGAFEENGVTGEKERIYESVLNELNKRTADYDAYLSEANETAKDNPAVADWLKTDSAYIASELRKSMTAAGAKTAVIDTGDLYSLEDLVQLRSFTNELRKYGDPTSGFANAVSTGNETEESLGMKLAELNLKGRVLDESGSVSQRVKDLVNRSIDNFTKNAITREQENLTYFKQLQTQAIQQSMSEKLLSSSEGAAAMEKVAKSNAALNVDAVYAVINKVDSVYTSTGDAGKAIMEGAAFAHDAYTKKAQSAAYDGITRYDDRSFYWENFYHGSNKQSPGTGASQWVQSTSAYTQTEAKLDGIISSWNQFMWGITSSRDALLQKVPFSVYA